MKLSCLQQNLAEGLNVVGRVVPSKSTLPVLSNVLLATDEGRLKLAATDLELNARNRRVHLKSGRYESNIAGIDSEDFPPIPTVEEGASITLDAAVLKDAVGQVAFAAAQDDSRPVLAGVLLKLQGDRLTLAAADGFRLAVREVDLPDGTSGGPGPQLNV